MSFTYTSLDSPFHTLLDEKAQQPLPHFRAQTPPSPFSFPSSPATSGEFDTFDLTAFEDPTYTFDLGSSTPSSVVLISPKSSFSSPPVPLPLDPEIDVEALSNHHLQRYLHYKSLVETANDTAALEALFGPMQGKDTQPVPVFEAGNMLGYPVQPEYYAPTQWNQSFGYQPVQVPMQGVPQIRQMPQTQYYPSQRSSFDQSFWSHQSTTTTQTASPPYPVTPVHSALPLNTAQPVYEAQPVYDAPRKESTSEEQPEDDEGEDELSDYQGDAKPAIPSMQVANLHGGGRGYVPGKTPDDPKKRHKCTVCGRGFARAFNLKSHAQTHNPLRAKPHQCPHTSCKRGFSRLHDLERHRQGIHCDGPLVDAKRIGISPSIARAKSRISQRAESGDLP